MGSQDVLGKYRAIVPVDAMSSWRIRVDSPHMKFPIPSIPSFRRSCLVKGRIEMRISLVGRATSLANNLELHWPPSAPWRPRRQTMEDNTKAALQQILLGVRHNRAPCSRWVLEPEDVILLERVFALAKSAPGES